MPRTAPAGTLSTALGGRGVAASVVMAEKTNLCDRTIFPAGVNQARCELKPAAAAAHSADRATAAPAATLLFAEGGSDFGRAFAAEGHDGVARIGPICP